MINQTPQLPENTEQLPENTDKAWAVMQGQDLLPTRNGSQVEPGEALDLKWRDMPGSAGLSEQFSSAADGVDQIGVMLAQGALQAEIESHLDNLSAYLRSRAYHFRHRV